MAAPAEARPLLAAYHEGAAALPAPFGAWASACLSEIDPAALTEVLAEGFAGLQLPATALQDPAGYERCAPLLSVLEERDVPLFVHPGAAPASAGVPGWWPALVPYVQQMHAAWFAFRAFGRPRHPRLRVCFAMLAGLAPSTANASPRGEADATRSTRPPTSRRPPTDRAPPTPPCAPSASTRSCTAPTARTRAPATCTWATPPTTRSAWRTPAAC
ncbi:hypothetical protein ACFQHO_32340 [Actinomadura yumaensis]|uniref:hypothetical protein n=1 Tax=Actinomadura yumaensis TaxID=111807 RepID=UPI00361017CA